MDFFAELGLLITYLFLGIFQGFTEPIPISSSGHLVILKELLDLNLQGLTFEIWVNFGSLIAVLIIYRQDILRLIQNSISYVTTRDRTSKNDFNFVFYLLIGTIPAGVIGVLFEDWISKTFGSSVKTVGITLIITGIALWIIRNLKGYKNDKSLTFKDALIVGFAQAVALIPGISRSGATLVAAMLLGMKQKTALRFSFLLYIPVSLGTLLLSVEDIIGNPNLNELWIPYLIALLASVIASYFSLKLLINIMAQGNLKYFTFYCVVVGALVFFLL